MQVGFHVSGDAPLDAAAARGGDCVQFFLSDPQSWRKPPPRDDADALRAADMPLYVHAPYLVNVASPDNRIRVPSRRILQDTCDAAATVGATAVIVHGGHVGADTEFGTASTTGARRWSGSRPTSRSTSRTPPAATTRWRGPWTRSSACGRGSTGSTSGSASTLPRARGGRGPRRRGRAGASAVGRIDLVHANDSRDPSGSGRDRHESLGRGEIPPDALAAAIAAADAPVICETPGDVDDHLADLAWLREHVAPAIGSGAAAG